MFQLSGFYYSPYPSQTLRALHILRCELGSRATGSIYYKQQESLDEALNPKPLNPKPLNPLKPKPLNPKPLSPKP